MRNRRRNIFVKNIGRNSVDRGGRRHFYRPGVALMEPFSIIGSEFYRAGQDNYGGDYSGYTSSGYLRSSGIPAVNDLASWAVESDTIFWSDSFYSAVLDSVKWTDISTSGASVTPTTSGLQMDVVGFNRRAGVGSNYRARDDFSWDVSWSIPSGFWPLNDMNEFYLEAWPEGSLTERFTVGFQMVLGVHRFFVRYYNVIGSPAREFVKDFSTAIQVGKIRLKRSGSSWTGEVYDGSTWQEIGVISMGNTDPFEARIVAASNNINSFQVLASNFNVGHVNRSDVREFPSAGFIACDGRDLVILDQTEQVWMRFVGALNSAFDRGEDWVPSSLLVENGVILAGVRDLSNVNGGYFILDFREDKASWAGRMSNISTNNRKYEYRVGSSAAPLSMRNGYNVCSWADVGTSLIYGVSTNINKSVHIKGASLDVMFRGWMMYQEMVVQRTLTDTAILLFQAFGLSTPYPPHNIDIVVSGSDFYVLSYEKYSGDSNGGPNIIRYFRDTAELVALSSPYAVITQADILRRLPDDIASNLDDEPWLSLAVTIASSPAQTDTLFIGAQNMMIVVDHEAPFSDGSVMVQTMRVTTYSTRNKSSTNAVLHGRVSRIPQILPTSTAGRRFGQLVHVVTSE